MGELAVWFQKLLGKKKLIFGSLLTIVDRSLQTILLYIMRSLARGGSVAAAVGVSDI